MIPTAHETLRRRNNRNAKKTANWPGRQHANAKRLSVSRTISPIQSAGRRMLLINVHRVWTRPSVAALATRRRARRAGQLPFSLCRTMGKPIGAWASSRRLGREEERRDGGTKLLRTPWWPRERNTKSFLKRFAADGRFVPTRATLIPASRCTRVDRL